MDELKIVTAAPGTKCPKEHSPREYITDSIPVNVPETAYYRRRIADGSLIVQQQIKPAPVAAIPDKKKGVHK